MNILTLRKWRTVLEKSPSQESHLGNTHTHTHPHYTDLSVPTSCASHVRLAGPGWTGLGTTALGWRGQGSLTEYMLSRSLCLMRHKCQRTMFNCCDCAQLWGGVGWDLILVGSHHSAKPGLHIYSRVSYQTRHENMRQARMFLKQEKLSTQKFSCHNVIFGF